MLATHGKNLEELVKKLYTELYLSVDEIARITKLSNQKVYNMLWRLKIIRTPVESKTIRRQLRQSSKEQKAEYIRKARELGVPYKIIAEVLHTHPKGVKRIERSLSSKF
jgi:chromosome condensin MukBEF MukE localization factor